MKKSGIKLIIHSVFFAACSLATALILFKVFGVSQDIVLTKVFQQSHIDDCSTNNILIVSASRAGHPLEDIHEMRKGDTIRLVGPMNVLNKVVKEFGYARNTGVDTDVSYMSTGIIMRRLWVFYDLLDLWQFNNSS